MIRVALERSLGVADGSGASCYAFPAVRNGARKQQSRGWLDSTPFSGDELDAELPRWTSS